MATKTVTHIIDDLDGTTGDGVQTVRFSLDGAHYEMELSQQNRRKLDAALRPFAEHARTVSTRVVESAASKARKRSRREGTPPWEIRAWAKENNIDLAERGRIPQDIIDRFEEARRGA